MGTVRKLLTAQTGVPKGLLLPLGACQLHLWQFEFISLFESLFGRAGGQIHVHTLNIPPASTPQCRQRRAKGPCPAPRWQRVCVGPLLMLLQLVYPDRQIAKTRQDARCPTMRDPAGILAQSDVSSVVRAVLDRRPMAPDDLRHLRVGVLLERTTRHVQPNLITLL